MARVALLRSACGVATCLALGRALADLPKGPHALLLWLRARIPGSSAGVLAASFLQVPDVLACASFLQVASTRCMQCSEDGCSKPWDLGVFASLLHGIVVGEVSACRQGLISWSCLPPLPKRLSWVQSCSGSEAHLAGPVVVAMFQVLATKPEVVGEYVRALGGYQAICHTKEACRNEVSQPRIIQTHVQLEKLP